MSISRVFLSGLFICALHCADPTIGLSQQSNALAEADQDFQRALEIWGDGKSPEAEALLNQALTRRSEALGPNDPKVAEVIERLGAVAFNRGKYIEAETQFRRALEIDVKAFGEKNVAVTIVMGDVGAALREQSRYREAREIVERSLALRRELLPPNHLAIGGSLNNLGRIFVAERRYSEARKALEESLRIYTASLPQGHPRVVEGQALLKVVDNAEVNANRFIKVFDVGDSGYRNWSFPAFGLIFVLVGIGIFVFPKIIKVTGIPYLSAQSRWQAFFRYGFLGFAVLWTTLAFVGTYVQHWHHKSLAQSNACRVVEGPVEQFVPMPYTGHANESFSVAGVRFGYSDYGVTDTFNNTSSHGGPINGNSYVRICFDPADHAILRLEIRDFKGEVKDYSKIGGMFATLEEGQKAILPNAAIEAPWDMNLFVIVYGLDFIGIQILFLPYLRTFFRFRSLPVHDCQISSLQAGSKVKLRNSLIYFDGGRQTIWLRPRGLNRLRLPLMVASLGVDPLAKSITARQVCFSSGFVLVMALFIWAAYRMFSVMPGGHPPPLFIGFAALMVLGVGFFTLRSHKARMENLVEEALSELCSQSLSAKQ